MSSGSLLIRHGTIVNEDSMQMADVLCENGMITYVTEERKVMVLNFREVGTNLAAPPNTREVDATGKFIIPGKYPYFMKFYNEVFRRDRSPHSYAVAVYGTSSRG